jgi:hypothetical protein
MSTRRVTDTYLDFKEWDNVDRIPDRIPPVSIGDRVTFSIINDNGKTEHITGYVHEATPYMLTLNNEAGNPIGTLTMAEFRRECEVCWELDEDDTHEERTCDGWITFNSLKYTKPESDDGYQAFTVEVTPA